MNSLMDEIDPEEEPHRSNTDVTLGVGSLLSIFFGVVLICGIFFGFGYSMGRRNAHSSSATSASTAKPAPADALAPRELNGEPLKPQISENGATDDASSATSKTPIGQADEPAEAAKAPVGKDTASRAAGERAAHDAATEDAGKTSRNTRVVESNAGDTALTAVPNAHRSTPPAKPHAGISAPLATPPPDAEPTPGHPVMVQIAAVSRQEDAEVLAGALRKRGFSPQVRPGTADKFFHVQVGPFTNKAEADSMKQHLLSDGYNAILK